ncbi:MAG: cation:proton antiporter [Salinivirgaceae bacterium]|nr:MAG: cation:proton antiporter [Salinivirgaceae bacterium]
MNEVLSIGILIFAGYLFGELADKIKLPKISGYILAGILLNPDLSGIMSSQFVEQTEPLLTISLSIITFSIGGSLSISKLKEVGRKVLTLTVLEALFAFFAVFVFMFGVLYFFSSQFDSLFVILALSLVLASLAAPTDPSATIAVIHEYKSKGEVSSTMLEIAAFDDIIGIILYSLVTAFAVFFMGGEEIEIGAQMVDLGINIGGAILVGGVIGGLFVLILKFISNQSEGTLIVLTIGLILLSYGISEYFGFESLLSTIALGMVIANFSPVHEKVFQLIDRYTDELIFVIFFTLSGMNLQIASITGSYVMIVVYIIARMIGKYMGIYAGSHLMHSSPKIKKYTAGGLIPQGGVVIGLALLLAKDPAFKELSSTIMGVVIGAALIHELIGPVLSKYSLKKAGEIE